MSKKMLVLDIDGTLTNSKKEITPVTKAAIEGIIEKGHIVVIASGRPTPGVMGVCHELELEKKGGYLLTFNGAKITNAMTGEVVYEKTFSRDYLAKILDFALKNDMGMMTYDAQNAITSTRCDEYMELEARINKIGLKQVENVCEYVDFDVNKCLLTAPVERAEKLEKELYEMYLDELSVYRSEPFFVEIMPKGVDKAAALSVLSEKIGIKREDMICCGDGFNDLSMIKYAGVGVAMANAVDSVKEAADYITLSNDCDGVAKAIEKFVI